MVMIPEEKTQYREMAEDQLQQLRSKASELFLREEWNQSVDAYDEFINLCRLQLPQNGLESDSTNLHKLRRSLCLALCNRAEARSRLGEYSEALEDCEQALEINRTHFKTLLCKGKILLNMDRYSTAMECFRTCLSDAHANNGKSEINGYLEKCKKLEFLSRTGTFDLSDWVINGFRGKIPELAEYMGAVEIRKSEISGRGLFATRNIDSGTLVLVTKAIATERSILPGQDLSEDAQLMMWKNFIHKVREIATKCKKTQYLISLLSTGEDEDMLLVPDISLFKPEIETHMMCIDEQMDMNKLLTVLDVNSLAEHAASSKVLGKNNDYYGIGLWLQAAFINHSCSPNARRLHVGDYLIVHTSRDVKAGDEITFSYFDPFSPFEKRKEMTMTWSFDCRCKRCMFEENMCSTQEMREIEISYEKGMDAGGVVFRLEEEMKRVMVRGREKGYVRASFWSAYSDAYTSDRIMKKWGRRIPTTESVVDSVADVVGSDERLVKILMERLKKNGGGLMEMEEKALKLGRGAYGKLVKKQAMRTLLEISFSNHEQRASHSH